MAYRRQDVVMARTYLEKQAMDRKDQVMDLLSVWSEEGNTMELKREAEGLRYSL